MNKNLLFDFTADKQNNTILISRQFDADLALVWEAWTNPEILDQWWAPKPFQTRTKSMDFRDGGVWLYAMVGPDATEHWCRADYQNIAHRHSYSAHDAFCDENGVINSSFPRALWNNTFTEQGGTTTVDIVIQYEQLSDLEKIIELGFKEGFSMALENLDQYLAARFQRMSELHNNAPARVSSYLNFPGNTEEAFMFYRSVFQSEFNGGIQRFGELPADPNHPPMAESVKKMVLHVELPILGNHVLMGTDAPKEMGFTVTKGNNMHIQLQPDSRAEAERIFKALSEGGVVSMPLQDMFWGAYFGSFSDKFGINWMVNCMAK